MIMTSPLYFCIFSQVRPYPPATRLSFEPLARAPDFHELPPVVPKRASHVNVLDPIGLIQKPPAFLLDMCDKYLQSHGFGTCGPRGFYGTTMEHLDLEKQLAHLFDTEACIFYAQGVSVASSVLASPMLGSKVGRASFVVPKAISRILVWQKSEQCCIVE